MLEELDRDVTRSLLVPTFCASVQGLGVAVLRGVVLNALVFPVYHLLHQKIEKHLQNVRSVREFL